MTSDATGTVIGTNLKRLRLRDSENQSECARRIARHGLDWNRDKVASLESGRRATVSVDELVILSWAYGIPITEWFEGEGTVTVGASVEADLDVVRDTLRGNVPKAVLADFSEAVDQSADESVASRLGVELESVLSLAKQLWGHSTTEERDRRLSATPATDPKAIRTLRAGMTKRLLREIEEAMS